MADVIRKLINLLGSHRGRWIALAIFAGAVSILDAATAVLVFALFRTLSSPEQGLELPGLGDMGRLIPGLDTSGLLLVGGLAIVFLFLVRSVAYVVQTYLQHRMANTAAVDISDRLIRGYLTMPYTFHLQRNSAELVRNTFDAVQRLAVEVLAPAIRTASEMFVVLAVLGVLVASAPLATVVTVLVFAPTVFALLRILHPRLQRLGRLIQEIASGSLQSLQQAFTGVRDIKIRGRERFFSDEFTRQRREHARARWLYGTAQTLPRTTIETVLVLSIATFLVFMILLGRSPTDAFATLGLIGFAAFRVLPSLSRILQQLNGLRFSAATVDDIDSDLRLLEHHGRDAPRGTSPPMPLRKAITLEDITFRYPGSAVDALEGITLEIPRGTMLGVVGPTGGGKTTLIDVLTGLLEPTEGRVSVDGIDIRENVRGWQQNLGVVPQSILLLDDTLRRNIAFGLPDEEIDDEHVVAAVNLAQLEPFVQSLPDGLDTMVGERGVRISGGQRQRVAIARALYHRPEVLVFDEATSALDNITEQDFMRSLAERLTGRTLILVAHRISTVRDCDRIVVITEGRIADAGTYNELLERSESFRQLATGTR